jgi:1,2-diacylglycerol 3-alpha-glucosyltransferase
MYEDYLHYIANGKLIRPVHVKQFSKLYTAHMSGIICPSQRVVDKLEEYEIEIPKYIVPTGIDVSKFRPVPKEATDKIKADYDITDEHIFLLSVSRISYEKNIQTILAGMPEVIAAFPNVRLLVVGDGPYKKDLEEQATELKINGNVIFAGEIPNEEISPVYQAADIFVSASDSETQGLTYTEAMAAKTRVVAKGNAYLDPLFDSLSLGVTYKENEDFAKSLIAYINGDYPEDDEILKNKLYEISSEAFGKTVSALYEKIISDYEYSETEIEDEDEGLSSLRIFRK